MVSLLKMLVFIFIISSCKKGGQPNTNSATDTNPSNETNLNNDDLLLIDQELLNSTINSEENFLDENIYLSPQGVVEHLLSEYTLVEDVHRERKMPGDLRQFQPQV